uniref:BUD13 homolog n=1 Tax=Syphacia muris TaxID=451379 RepID=A0A158R425_9BILA
MSSSEATKLSMEEYLKRYMSGSKSKSKKKKAKHKDVNSRMKIHDDDAFIAVPPNTSEIPSDEDDREDLKREIEMKMKLSEKSGFFKKDTFRSIESPNDMHIKQEIASNSDESSHETDHIGTDSKPFSNKQKQQESGTQLPSSKRHHHPDSDQSPPRQLKHGSGSDISSRRRRHDSDSDQSPPRQPKHGSGSDVSSRRRRHDSDSDQSPPGQPKHGSGSNISSRRRRHDSDSDQSPPRQPKHGFESNISSRGRHHDSDSDLSPPRQSKHGSESNDLPLHQKHLDNSHSNSRVAGSDHQEIKSEVCCTGDISDGKQKITLEGKKAGLQSSKNVRDELKELRRKENEMFEKMSEEISGKNAATVHHGKKIGKQYEAPEEREKKEFIEKKQKELEEKYKHWNRGVRQIKQRVEDVNEMARVAQEEFARTADNKAMNDHMKEVLLKEDPMLEHVKKKRYKKALQAGEVYPTYEGSWEPNRFNIPPGYRWDGVDRSNGFERRIAEMANRKVAQEKMYYETLSKYE